MRAPTIVGIDTLALRFQIVGDHRYNWVRFGSRAEDRGHLSVLDGWARVEASLARRSNGERALLLDPRNLADAAQDLAHEAARFVQPAHRALEPTQLLVARIDPAVDFSTPVPAPALLRGLAEVPHPARVKRTIHEDNARCETVEVGSSSWRVRAYDQERKRGRTSVLRVEVQLRRRRLRSVFARNSGGMINVLADATPDKLASLWRATFEHVGFHSPICLDREAALRSLAWPSRRVIRLLGVLEAQRLGVYEPGSRHTNRTDAALVRSFHDELCQAGSSTRLDAASGTVITT